MSAPATPVVLGELRPTLLLRLQFIEFLLGHYGTLNRRALVDYFSLSMPQASMDIHLYLELAPGNAEYDPFGKTYRRAESFKRLWP